MNKKLFIFICITLLVVFMGLKYRPQPQIVNDKPDAYEMIKYEDIELNNSTDCNDIYLLFDIYKLDTSNFEQVMSFFDNYGYHVIEVYPYINPLYEQRLNGVYRITYNGISLKDGIAKIYAIYMAELEKYNLSDEIDKALVNGIRIRMVKINLNNNVLHLFLKRYQGVQYSLKSYGLFKSF